MQVSTPGRAGAHVVRTRRATAVSRAISVVVGSLRRSIRKSVRDTDLIQQPIDELEKRTMFAGTPLDFLPQNPLGGRIYTAAASAQLEDSSAVAEYEVHLISGQKLSARVLPQGAPTLQPQITILDDEGNIVVSPASAPAAGKQAIVQRAGLDAGTYTIRIEAAGNDGGNFALSAQLNESIEEEQPDAVSNDTPATGVNLSGDTTSLQGSGRIVSVTGIADGYGANGPRADYYGIDLQAGESIGALISPTGSGYGQFSDVSTLRQLPGVNSVATGDFNEDGLVDIVLAGEGNFFDGRVHVLLNNGDGGFTVVNWGGGDTVWDIAVGDFNNDGHLDIASIGRFGFDEYYSPGSDVQASRLTLFYGDGAGNAAFSIDDFISAAYTIASGDINNDGLDDLAIGHFPQEGSENQETGFSLRLSDPFDDSLPNRSFLRSDGTLPIYDIQIADLNNDGFGDVVTGEGNADETHGRTGLYLTPTDAPGQYIASDYSDNGPAHPVIRVAAARVGGTMRVVSLYLGANAGDVNVAELHPEGYMTGGVGWAVQNEPFGLHAGLVLADVNNDDFLDLITTTGNPERDNHQYVTVSLNGRDGYFFGGSNIYDTISHVGAIAVADFTGDGDLDLIGASTDRLNDGGDDYSDLALRVGQGEVRITLTDDQGNTFLYPVGGGAFAHQAITDFVAPTAGTYYIAVNGDKGQAYHLALTGAAQLGLDPQTVSGQRQQINGSRQMAGRIYWQGEVDTYALSLKAGDIVSASVLARTLGVGDSLNTLTPILRLLDPSGVEVASDQNVSGDPDASIVAYTVPADGTYAISVSGQSNYGDYDLLVSGSTGSLPPFTLRAGDIGFPQAGQVVTFRPWITLNFSHPVLASSLQAGDILINEQPATAIASISGDSVTFRTDELFASDGLYTIKIAAGAITSSLGVPIEAAEYTFRVDANGPRVVSSSIAPNAVLEPGSRTWHVDFSEPVRRFRFGAFGSFFEFIRADDIETTNLSSGASVQVSQIISTTIPDPDNGDPTGLDFVYSNFPEGQYSVRLKSGLGAFSSAVIGGGEFDGNPLDGEFNGTFPSGDGYAGGDFVMNFAVDTAGVTPITQLTARSPVGSLVHELAIDRAFHATGDVDSFSISLDSSQQITLMLVPTSNSSAEAKLELFDPSGASLGAASGAAGQTVLLDSIAGTTGGTYRIDASSLNGIAGYTLRVIVNAAMENEAVSGQNNSRASAQALNLRTLVNGFAGVRAAVVGNAAGSDDYYKIDLLSGQPVSFALSGVGGSSVSFVLQDPSGNVITRGAGGQYNAEQTAIDYLTPAAGTYYVVVSGNGAYNLLATRGASIEREAEVAAEPAQDLSIGKQVVGHLKGGTPSSGAIRVLHVGPNSPTNGSANLDLLINQLNDDTYYNFDASRTNAAGADTIEELQEYDLVVLTTLTTSTANPGLATALKKFVELGGAVVVVGDGITTATTFTLGAFAPLLPYNGASSYSFASGPLVPSGSHPITASISSIDYPVTIYSPAVLSGTTVATNGGKATVIVRENLGNNGRTIYVGANYADQFSTSASLRAGSADRLLEQTLAYAALSGDQSDAYSLSLSAGDSVVIATSTPTGETALPTNLIDPVLELYSPSGVLLATNDNGPDGRNARLTFNATAAGTYRVVVRAKDADGGAYTIQVTGATGSALVVGPKVIATTPTTTPVPSAPGTIDIILSENILASSVQISDLTVVGGTVTAAQLIDGRTVRFTVNVPDVDTTYTYSVPAGAFTDLQGDLSEAFSGNATIDKLGPYVVSSNPASQASSPFKLWSFTFSENLAALPSSYNYDTFFDITGPNGAVPSWEVRSISIEGNVFNIEFYGLTTQGNYTVTLKPAGFKDLRGNAMNQDQDTVNGETTQDRYSSTITLASPNLVVDSVEVLTPAVFGSQVTVRWTVRNAGTDPANDAWQDQLFLSTDDAIDGNDLSLLTLGAATVPLAPGQSYTRTQTITLPLNVNVTPGSYRFVVRTDRQNRQQESNENDNVTASSATSVTLPALPDLVTSNVELVSPATPASGGVATIRWTLTNAGTAAVSGVIRERVSLSSDAVAGGDTSLNEFDYAINLGAGQSVVRTAQVNLPINQYGQRYFVVFTDANNVVFEHTNEPNNTALSAPVTITLAPVPDLVISNVTAPSNVASGTTQQITWTLTNTGTATFSGTISESVYLSDDTTLGQGDDFFTNVSFTGTIAPGASITRSADIDIPISYSGSKRVIVVTDAANQVFEDAGDANNITASAAPMTITTPPVPDLVVSSITAPSTQVSGRPMQLSWTITNNGTAASTGNFIERVYLSSDGQIGNDDLPTEFTFTGTIAAGQTVTRTQSVSIPNIYEGTYRVVVVADANNNVFENGADANNAAIDDNTVQIAQSPYPNLRVSSITVPATAQSEEQIDIDWIVTNEGNAGTSALQWYDRVYLSANDTFDSTDVVLATVANASYLNAGESYPQTTTLTLPRGLQGDYYVFVVSDINNNVYEYASGINAEDDNRTRSSAIGITLSPPPDLQVTGVKAPLLSFSGEPVEVSWTVTNRGAGATRSAETTWRDRLYLSADTVLDGADRSLGEFVHTGALDPNAAYNASGIVRLPVGVSGDYYILVVADSNDQVYEDAFEANNLASDTTQVLLAPPPDLHVTSLTAPSIATAGRTLAITYTVTNEGAEATPNGGWSDHFYLSPTPEINAGTLIYLGARSRSGALDAEESYQATFNAAVPLNLQGDYYVFMQTDASNDVFELDNANNIVGSVTPVSITPKFADLQATSFKYPANAEAGSAAAFAWEVSNAGTGDTITGSWTDRVVLSGDNVYGNGDDISLDYVYHTGLVQAGESYKQTQSLGIPQWVADGTYNVFLAIDAGASVIETDDANNINTFSPGTITIARISPDLQVDNVTAPAGATGGATIPVSFVVKNAGTTATAANSWVDEIWLSKDGTIGTGDVLLNAIQHTNALPVDGTYTVNTTITLPDVNGTYFLVVRTDRNNSVVESLDTNNDGASGAIAVSPQQLPDLSATSVSGPSSAFSGQITDLSWTITNTGSAISTAYWYDTVYLSADATLDRTDIALGNAQHSAPMGAGASYTVEQSVKLPPGLSGQYYFIVATDATGRVYERDQRLNNIVASTPTTLQLLPPADLVAGTIVLPINGTPGQVATIEYNVRNDSTEAAQGKWIDSVYLSADDKWDIHDALFGKYTKTGPVGADEEYTGSITAPLPGVRSGEYYVIVRSDILNQIPEANETNNLSASLDAFSLDVPALTLDTPSTGTLARGQGVYYRVDVPAGETLLIDLDAAATSGSTQLFVSYEDVPSRSSFDFGYTQALSPDQKIVVPKTKAGTYYILAYGDSLTAPSNYSIEARILQFEAIDTDYGVGGNGGKLTLQINGAKFDRTITPTIVSPTGATRAAQQVFFTSSTRLYATFDLAGLTPGDYDVKLTKTAGESVMVPDSLHVVAAQAAQAKPYIFAPEITGVGALFQFTVAWGNDGINDVPAPYLVVTADRAIGKNPNFIDDRAYTFIGVGQDDGPAGVIRPDQTSQRDFYARNGPRLTATTIVADRLADERMAEAFDWESIRNTVRTPGYSDEEFALVFAQLIADVGTTWGDYVTALASGASLLPAELGDAQHGGAALQVAIQKAAVKVSTSISGAIFAPDIDVPIAGRVVSARNINTEEVFATTSLNDGSFYFDRLAPGTYELSYDGGRAIAGQVVSVSAGQHVTGQQLTVERGGQIAGTVRRSGDNAAIAGVVVHAYNDDGKVASATTDAAGFYVIGGLLAGHYTVFTDAPSYARAIDTSVSLDTDDASAGANFALVSPAKIVGTVNSAVGPATPIEVTAFLNGATGDPSAVFAGSVVGSQLEIADLPAGEYEVVIERDGYVSVTLTVTVGAGQQLNLGTVQLARAAAVSGTVVGHGSINVNGMPVALYRNGLLVAGAIADGTGHYEFANVEPGNYTLKVKSAKIAYSQDIPITVGAGAALDADIDVYSGSSITGTVVDSTAGAPVAGLKVTLALPDGTVRSTNTDASGSYSFENLDVGAYRVSVPGTSASATISSVDGSVVNTDLTLAIAATVSGKLLTSSGQSLAGQVRVYSGAAVIASTSADNSGNFSLRLLEAGTYRIVALSPDGTFTPLDSVVLGDGAVLSHNFVTGTGVVTATIAGSSAVVNGATVVLRRTDGGSEAGTNILVATAGGAVLFDNLAAGQYELTIVGASGNVGARTSVTVGAGTTALGSISLTALGVVSGAVTAGASLPVAKAQIVLLSTATDGAAIAIPLLTDGSGNYSATNVFPGTYTLVVYAQGYRTYVQPTVVINAGANLSINPVLVADASRLTGRAIDGSGNVITSGDVVITDNNGVLLRTATLNADGTFSIEGLIGTHLVVTVYAAGGKTVVTEVNIGTGATVALGDVAITSAGLTISSSASDLAPFSVSGRSLTTDLLSTTSPMSGAKLVATQAAVITGATLPVLAGLSPDEFAAVLDSNPGFVATAINIIRGIKRDPSELKPEDLSDLDKCRECENTRQVVLNEIEFTRRRWTAVQNYSRDFWKSLKDVVTFGLFDLAQTGGIVAKYFFAFQSITTQGVFGAIDNAAHSISRVDVGAMFTQIASGVYSLYSLITGLQETSDLYGLPGLFNDIGAIVNNLGGLIFNFLNIFTTVAGSALAAEVAAPMSVVFSVLSLVTDLRQDLANFYMPRFWDSVFDLIGAVDYCNDAYYGERGYLKQLKRASEANKKYEMCLLFADCDGSNDNPFQIRDTVKAVKTAPPGDPNDIIGPEGFGPQKYVSATIPLDYRIRFENMADAQAPAREVTITQTLDSDLNPATFRLGDFSIGGVFFDVPAGSSFYQTRIDLTESRGIFLDVVAGIDITNNQAFWRFISIDPQTGDVPDNPLMGFLPQNVDGIEGQAMVQYTIRPRTGVPTGTLIDALATIVFDQEAPIDTPAIFNTLDGGAPSSAIDALPDVSAQDFLVLWRGDDDANGSAIATFDVYVSKDGGAYELWLDDTDLKQGVYQGVAGSTYAFYSIAVDNSGNIEGVPTTYDAITTVSGVANTPPMLDVDTVGASLDEGSLFTRAGVASDLDVSDVLTAQVQYGDGDDFATLALNPDGTFNLSHTYADNGAYTITVRLTDTALSTVEKQIVVTVNNLPPTIAPIDDVVIPWDGTGGTLNVGSSFTDPGADTFTGEVSFGGSFVPLAVNADGTFTVNNRFTTPGDYTVTVRVTDDDLGQGIATFSVRLLPPKPIVNAVQVNDGNIQRSMVKSLVINFSNPVTTFPGSAVTIKLRTPTGPQTIAATLATTKTDAEGKVWTITWTGAGLEGGSLADGVYDVSIDQAQLTDAYGQAGTGVTTATFHRLFGDRDGDRDTDGSDVTALRKYVNKPASYIWHYDIDSDGDIDQTDFLAAAVRSTKVLFS